MFYNAMISKFQTWKRSWRIFLWVKGIMVYTSCLFSWLCFFRKFLSRYQLCPILILHKISFKMRGHMAIFWNLAQGIIFRLRQSGKIKDIREFLLLWNGHPSFFGRVLGPLPEKSRMVCRDKCFCKPYYRA